MTARRSLLLALPALLGACSVLPDRPYQESRRYLLAPRRTGRVPARRGAPVLLVRVMRAAPGLDQRGLRSLGAEGRITLAYWDEWAAPPAEAAEEALRRWMTDAGLFSAVIAPGSRLQADVIMEAELVRLEAVPAAGQARAALSVLVLSNPARDPVGEARVLGQILAEGTAPLARGASAPPEAMAEAMEAALGTALAGLERQLRPLLPAAGGARRG